eukprot:scaffold11667_cov127-Isochrysis_galbana.AAC.5
MLPLEQTGEPKNLLTNTNTDDESSLSVPVVLWSMLHASVANSSSRWLVAGGWGLGGAWGLQNLQSSRWGFAVQLSAGYPFVCCWRLAPENASGPRHLRLSRDVRRRSVMHNRNRKEGGKGNGKGSDCDCPIGSESQAFCAG